MLRVDLEKKTHALYRPYKFKVIIERDHKRKLAAGHDLQMKWREHHRQQAVNRACK